jgi:hypothetical protein
MRPCLNVTGGWIAPQCQSAGRCDDAGIQIASSSSSSSSRFDCGKSEDDEEAHAGSEMQEHLFQKLASGTPTERSGTVTDRPGKASNEAGTGADRAGSAPDDAGMGADERERGEFDRERGRTMREARRKAGNGGNLVGNSLGRPFIIEKRSKTGSDRPRLLPVDKK